MGKLSWRTKIINSWRYSQEVWDGSWTEKKTINTEEKATDINVTTSIGQSKVNSKENLKRAVKRSSQGKKIIEAGKSLILKNNGHEKAVVKAASGNISPKEGI